ncbi:MAG: hypothetical protein EOO40_02220, partial [Deltaproteobacteria bacterium]
MNFPRDCGHLRVLIYLWRKRIVANQKYPQEFRDEAVRQVRDRGYAVKDVAKNLGVPAHNLYKWLKQVRPEPEKRREEELLEARRENLKLRAEFRRVEEERDIL